MKRLSTGPEGRGRGVVRMVIPVAMLLVGFLFALALDLGVEPTGNPTGSASPSGLEGVMSLYVQLTLPPTALFVFIIAGLLAPPIPFVTGALLGLLDAVLVWLLLPQQSAVEQSDVAVLFLLAVVLGSVVTGITSLIVAWFLRRRRRKRTESVAIDLGDAIAGWSSAQADENAAAIATPDTVQGRGRTVELRHPSTWSWTVAGSIAAVALTVASPIIGGLYVIGLAVVIAASAALESRRSGRARSGVRTAVSIALILSGLVLFFLALDLAIGSRATTTEPTGGDIDRARLVAGSEYAGAFLIMLVIAASVGAIGGLIGRRLSPVRRAAADPASAVEPVPRLRDPLVVAGIAMLIAAFVIGFSSVGPEVFGPRGLLPGWLAIGIPGAIVTAVIIGWGLRLQRRDPSRRWPILFVGLLAGVFAGLAMIQAIWAEGRWPHRRRLVDAVAITAGASLALLASYGAIGPPFGIGPLIDSGRIVREDAGYAITLPRDWRVEDISNVDTPFGEAIPAGMRPELIAAAPSLDETMTIFVIKSEEKESLADLSYYAAEAGLEPVNLPAAATYRFELALEDETHASVYPFSQDEEAFVVVYFYAQEPPDDHWLSIARTVEFLETAEPAATPRPDRIEVDAIEPFGSFRPIDTDPGALTVAVDGSGDTMTLAAALESVEPGGHVELGPGTFAGGFDITSDVTITGAADGSTTILVPWDRPGLEVRDGNLTLRRVALRNDRSNLEPAAAAIDVAGGTATIDDCAISDVRVGIVARDGAQATIGGCTFARISDTALLLSGVGTRGAIRDSEITASQNGLTVVGGAAATVDGNTIVTRGPGVRVSASGPSRIEDNDIDAGSIGMEIDDAAPSVRANRVSSPELGILVDGGASPTLSENTISTASGTAIFVSGKDSTPTIQANEISGGEWGILAGAAADPTIEGNSIRGSETGIELDATSGTVRDNRISEATWGITLRNGASPLVSGNTITDSETTGIAVTGAATTPTVRANEISGGVWGLSIADGAEPSIEENSISGSETGIELEAASGTVRDNHISDATWGMTLRAGATPLVAGNTFTQSATSGITISGPATTPTIQANEISGGEWGLWIDEGARPTVQANSIDGSETGIQVDAAAGSLRDNHISGAVWGMTVANGATPLVVGNTLTDSEATAIVVTGAGTTPTVRDNEISGGDWGFVVFDEAQPTIEGNSISGSETGFDITAASGTVRDNRISEATWGLSITEGAAPLVDGNTVTESETGISIENAGSMPTVRGNEISGGTWGIWVDDGAAPSIEVNSITDTDSAIGVVSASGSLRGNHISGAEWGITMQDGATSLVSGNIVSDSRTGIRVENENTMPEVHGNEIDGGEWGIWIEDGARPTIAENSISGSETGIYVSGDGTTSTIQGNKITGGEWGIWIEDGAQTTIEGNSISGTSVGIYAQGGRTIVTRGGNAISGSLQDIYLVGGASEVVNANAVGETLAPQATGEPARAERQQAERTPAPSPA